MKIPFNDKNLKDFAQALEMLWIIIIKFQNNCRNNLR